MAYAHRWLRMSIRSSVIIAGGAAGVSAAFNTPLAGVAFAIEELAAAYEQRMTLLVMTAVLIAGMTSLGIAGDYIYFGANDSTLPLRQAVVIAPTAGIIGGLAGGLFARILLVSQEVVTGPLAWLRSRPIRRALLMGLIVALIGVLTGLTWGTGYSAARALIEGQNVSAWFGPAKFLATLASSVAGLPGGIFSPSLATGAGLGSLLTPLFPGAPAGAVVLLGVGAYFTGVVRAPLTAVIIIMETTASRGLLLPLLAAALVADAVSKMVCRERLYHGLARQMMGRPTTPPE